MIWSSIEIQFGKITWTWSTVFIIRQDDMAEIQVDDIQGKVNELQEWAAEQKGAMAKCKTWKDTNCCEMFLRYTNLNMDLARARLLAFCEFRDSCPEWYRGRDPEQKQVNDLLDVGAALLLPEPHPKDGACIVVIRSAAHDPWKTSLDNINRVNYMLVDLAEVVRPDISKTGMHIIYDMNNFGMRHAFQMGPTFAKRVLKSIQDCYPADLLSLHFINIAKHAEAAIGIFKMFMSQETKEKFKMHGKNLPSLHEVFPPHVLPKELGGTSSSYPELIGQMKKALLDHQKWFVERETLEFS